MTLIKKNININFEVRKGDSFDQTFEFVDCVAGVETPIDLTGSTIEFKVSDINGVEKITGSTSLTGSPANTINVYINESSTILYPTTYYYYLQVVGVGSPITTDTYITGTFEICE